MAPRDKPRSGAAGLLSVRYGIPALLVAVGLGFLLFGSDDIRLEAWVGFTGAGLSVLLNTLYRMGVSGDTERDREAEARAYLDEHGRWPDEARREEGDQRASRRWRLPEGVATPESEARAADRARDQ
jgi:hypothetical protein